MSRCRRYATPSRTYYISAAGNDSNHGTSADAPWLTVGKVNVAALKPGDRVLFRRGDTWDNSSLIPPASGNAKAPIYFGNYGAGDLPLLDTTTRYTDFTLDEDAVYKRTETSHVLRQVFEDEERLTYAADRVSMTEGSWTWVDGTHTLYVWCTDSGNPNSDHVIDYDVTLKYGVDFNGKSYLVFDGLHCTKNNVCGFYFLGSAGSRFITIQNCEVTKSWNQSIWMGGYTFLGLSNIYVLNNNLHNGIQDLLWLGNGRYIIARNNNLYDASLEELKAYPMGWSCTGITVGLGADDVTIQYNHVYNQSQGAGIYIEHEEQPPADANQVRPTNVLVEHNLVEVSGTVPAMVEECTGTIIRNNILIHMGDGYGLTVQDNSVGVKVYHNTFYSGTAWACNLALDVCTNADVRNNLFLRALATKNGVSIPAAGQSGLTWNNNLFWSGAGNFRSRWGATWYTTFAEWQAASGMDANSIEDDPDCVTYGSDFHLQATSPAIGAGATGTGVAVDYDSVVRGSPPDIGAYEYV